MSQSTIAPELRGRAKYLRPAWVPQTGLSALGAMVATMHRELSQHVACEEGPCGFFAFVGTAAPRYGDLIERLWVDHLRLGRALAALRMKILRARPLQLEELTAECDAIALAIVEHDELEWEILRDVFE